MIGFCSSHVVKMIFIIVLSISILVLHLNTSYSNAQVKSATFLSEKLELEPGLCVKKYLFNVDFPKGHIGIKRFDAELVDEKGKSLSLNETYLHHWLAVLHLENNAKPKGGVIAKLNNGPCYSLPHFWGRGSESRGTTSDIPNPFAVEMGNPEKIAKGYEEKWVLDTMIIDLRGVQDKHGCAQCRCNLYNVTKDVKGVPLNPEYKGGFNCCYDNTQCKLKEGFHGPRRSVHLRYTIKWVEWDQHQIGVKVYILDSTDEVVKNGSNVVHNCKVEYSIIPENGDRKPVHVQKASIPLEKGGYLIYGVAHQHGGSAGSTLYGQDGQILCNSRPRYGTGKEPGNEEGYLVAMSECVPKPGSVKINDNEILTLESRYNNTYLTGLMGHFSIFVAEKLQQ
ncbi:PREDICTED: uncharacterized protein LOC109359543 [Lupinus angustifolius]|nr:PREDICTED: uncharacterized protein LOC109359543 [Lupinus angustifolius]